MPVKRIALKKKQVGSRHTQPELELWELEQKIGPGRVPRVSKLIKCAVLIDHKIRTGEFANQAEVAKKYRLTTMSVSRLLQLLQLAPDIAEEVMFLPLVKKGADPIKPRLLRPIHQEWSWEKQRKMWADLKQAKGL